MAIIHLLHVDPRVPFARIGELLDCSEQTVARRYRRLVSQGLLRIVAVVDPNAYGQSSSLIRIRARPDSARSLAQALAARDDVLWVTIADGGTEIAASIQSRNDRDRDELLLERLPRTAHVLSLTVLTMLHRFVPTTGIEWTVRSPVVTAEMEQALRPAPPSKVRRALDAEDEVLIGQLTLDGRASIADLAAACRSTANRTARRLSQLLDSGVLYLDIDVSHDAIGPQQTIYFWLTVEPAHLAAAGQLLAELVEVAFVAATTGLANLLVVAQCADMPACYAFLTDQLGQVDGVRQVEVSAVLRRVKQAGSWVLGSRLSSLPTR